MSGGSLDYAHWKVEEIASQVEGRAETSLHRAFAHHLLAVAAALHDLEWVWSGDKSDGDEVAAIELVVSPAAALKSSIVNAESALEDLQLAIARAKEREGSK